MKQPGEESFALPEDFIFGVSNSGYQAEGGINEGDGPRNNWSVWEESGRAEKTGKAVDFWNNPDMHIEKARSLGMNAFRMGIERSRVQPRGPKSGETKGQWDEVAIQRYGEIISKIQQAGMKPLITLHHFTHPLWLGSDPWLDASATDVYVQYAVSLVEKINTLLLVMQAQPVLFWVTFNEPNLFPMMSYIAGEAPAGKKGFKNAMIATDNMLYAHIRIYDKLHELFQAKKWPAPQVGINTFCMSIYEFDRIFYDLLLAPLRGITRNKLKGYMKERRKDFYQAFCKIAHRRFGALSYQRAYYLIYRNVCSMLFNRLKLKRTIDALYASASPWKIDYVALDIYDPFVTGAFYLRNPFRKHDPMAEPIIRKSWWDWHYDAQTFQDYLTLHGNNLPAGIPVYVLETCIAHKQERYGKPVPRKDGISRERFLRESIGEVVKAHLKGIPVRGYVYWSLTDNYEWGSFTPRLGLLTFDFKSMTIMNTDAFGIKSGDVYKSIIEALKSGNTEIILQELGGIDSASSR